MGTKQITIFLINNHSKHEKKVEITQKIQKEARNGQTLSRRFKWIAILFFFFGKLVCLNSFKRSFLLFVAFDIMLGRQAYLTRTCDFFIHKQFLY